MVTFDKSDRITLSEKYGLNPAIPKCFYCGDDKNELICAGQLPGDNQAPKNCVWDMSPCDTCAAHMKIGIILISVKTSEFEKMDAEAHNYKLRHHTMRGFIPNPHRSGKLVVVKETALRRIVESPLLERILRHRWSFVEDEAWAALGLDAAISTSRLNAEGAD